VASTNPFTLPGRFLKGNLHTHTKRSDGTLSPEETAALFRDRGHYDFLVLTDHRVLAATDELCSEGFTVVPGVELHPGKNELGHAHHILCVGVAGPAELAKLDSPQGVLTAVSEAGGVCFMAHPRWHGCTFRDLMELEGYAGVEVFNTTCSALNGKGDSTVIWDDLLARGRRTLGVAVDDAHLGRMDYFGGWAMVRTDNTSAAGIVAALKAGAFYSSCGPEIRGLEVTKSRLKLECSPVRSIHIASRGPVGASFVDPGGALMDRLECKLGKMDTYVRVQIVDASGMSAWTNPFYLDELDA